MQMTTKGNVVLYLDRELVEKSKEMGFNLSKTFENHLKHLINGNSLVSMQNKANYSEYKGNLVGLPVPIPEKVQNHYFRLLRILFFCQVFGLNARAIS